MFWVYTWKEFCLFFLIISFVYLNMLLLSFVFHILTSKVVKSQETKPLLLVSWKKNFCSKGTSKAMRNTDADLYKVINNVKYKMRKQLNKTAFKAGQKLHNLIMMTFTQEIRETLKQLPNHSCSKIALQNQLISTYYLAPDWLSMKQQSI